MIIELVLVVALGMIVIERRWPNAELPRVDRWWPRVVFVNVVQCGVVVLAGLTWERWLSSVSLIRLRDAMPDWTGALVAYVVSTLIYYAWHRVRHESKLFWRLCHQLHHSPRRIEVLTSFYKHPFEIALNSILSCAIVYALLGASPTAGAYYTGLIAIAELFYHWNVRTPRWVGWIVQRPESHRVHHAIGHHTQNFADLPVWDALFGTLSNPKGTVAACGFTPEREDRFDDMLGFRDVHAPAAGDQPPLRLLPTCFGCSKRWKCRASEAAR